MKRVENMLVMENVPIIIFLLKKVCQEIEEKMLKQGYPIN